MCQAEMIGEMKDKEIQRLKCEVLNVCTANVTMQWEGQ